MDLTRYPEAAICSSGFGRHWFLLTVRSLARRACLCGCAAARCMHPCMHVAPQVQCGRNPRVRTVTDTLDPRDARQETDTGTAAHPGITAHWHMHSATAQQHFTLLRCSSARPRLCMLPVACWSNPTPDTSPPRSPDALGSAWFVGMVTWAWPRRCGAVRVPAQAPAFATTHIPTRSRRLHRVNARRGRCALRGSTRLVSSVSAREPPLVSFAFRAGPRVSVLRVRVRARLSADVPSCLHLRSPVARTLPARLAVLHVHVCMCPCAPGIPHPPLLLSGPPFRMSTPHRSNPVLVTSLI